MLVSPSRSDGHDPKALGKVFDLRKTRSQIFKWHLIDHDHREEVFVPRQMPQQWLAKISEPRNVQNATQVKLVATASRTVRVLPTPERPAKWSTFGPARPRR